MPIKYIPYYPNTVEGQAILNNITRTQRVLRYRENDTIYDRIKRGMPYYETELLETVGEKSDNLVIRGECISACAYLKEQGITSIIISHKLNEIKKIADSVTVIRDGKTIETIDRKDVTEERIIKDMVGRDLEHRYPDHTPNIGEEIFRVDDMVDLPEARKWILSTLVKKGRKARITYRLCGSGAIPYLVSIQR